jgi:hypothetical protein
MKPGTVFTDCFFGTRWMAELSSEVPTDLGVSTGPPRFVDMAEEEGRRKEEGGRRKILARYSRYLKIGFN